eukprot:gene3607-4132_t
MAPTTFYIAVGMFGLAAMIMGPWLERNGPRRGILLGGSLFCIGQFLTSIAIHVQHIWLVYVGYGVIGGYGLGLTYISPVSALLKWFPDHRGLAAGFAVAGFGAGSIAFSEIPLHIISSVGLALTFTILSCIFAVILALQALVFRVPPPNYQVHGMGSDRQSIVDPIELAPVDTGSTIEPVGTALSVDQELEDPIFSQMPLTDALFSRDFRVLYFLFFANAIFGLVAISRLSSMIQDIFGKDKALAATIVSINGGFNLAGRLGLAAFSDRFGRKFAFGITITAQAIIVGILPTLVVNRSYKAFVALIWILTSCYGGGFGVIPAFLTDMFGSKNIGACHGVILTAWSLAGVGGGLVFTAVFNHYKHNGHTVHDPILYTTNFRWVLVIVLLGWSMLWILRTTARDRLFPAAPGQILRINVFGRMIRLTTKHGVEILSKEQENAEWKAFLTDYHAKREKIEPTTIGQA